MSSTLDFSPPGHVRISLVTSILSSVVVGVLAAGVTWGMYSARLDSAEKEIQAWRLAALQLDSRNASQDTEIAVIKAQYTEILRRLGSIESAVTNPSRNRSP